MAQHVTQVQGIFIPDPFSAFQTCDQHANLLEPLYFCDLRSVENRKLSNLAIAAADVMHLKNLVR